MRSEREKAYNREYQKRPEVAAKRKAYAKMHNQEPEIKEKNRERVRKYQKTPSGREAIKKYRKKWVKDHPDVVKDAFKKFAENPKYSPCAVFIRRHHEELKDDPEHLTTEFLVNLTGCECERKEN